MTKNFQSSDPCVACGSSDQACFHHVLTRKAHPEYTHDVWNKMPLCAIHHAETHQLGTLSFSKKYPRVFFWLKQNSWEYCPYMKKYRNQNEGSNGPK